MTLEEWSQCPSCESPALYSSFRALVERNGECPMCMKPLNTSEIVISTNPRLALEKWQGIGVGEESLSPAAH